MRQKIMFLLAGVALGMALLSGGSALAAVAQTAVPSDHVFYVDGRLVSLAAYEIGGSNYLKLRDIGQAVGFNVYWDGTVQIESDQPYTGVGPAIEAPVPVPTPVPQVPSGGYTITTSHWSREDFSQRANPSVFTGIYDRALYNTIRQTLVDRGPGNAPAYTMVDKQNYGEVKRLLGRMDNTRWLQHYVPQNFTNYYEFLDYFAVSIKVPEQQQAALNYIQPAIAQAAQMGTDREKVEYLHDYLCALLTYDAKAASVISQIFAPRSGELKGSCASYARSLNFLCDAAGIPSLIVSSSTHSWNLVYADGLWLYVDVSADDLHSNKNALLVETYPRHTDIAPQATAFLKELLVPGSTK